MSQSFSNKGRTMGTLPVFMTAISTILGAILFLRFGYAVSHVGLFMTLMIIVLGHAVTIPTAMAVAEIATNQRVEGGGAYYIISRSFGLNIGGAIGITLFLSQAISVAFYVIAFTVACEGLIEYANVWLANNHPDLGFVITSEMVNYTIMGLLTVLMLTKGANIGVKALNLVVALLFLSLLMFFLGRTEYTPEEFDMFSQVGRAGSRDNPDSFFTVFTIIFPAFTGIAAGLGLSGDLKDPKRSIPKGTMWATIGGIVVYVAVAFKLYFSASQEDLADNELIMQNIAIWGPIIPIGLGAAAMSSALGSIMIAPRTMQALGADDVFPGSVSRWMAKGKRKDNEPVNASIITCLIAFVFVSLGELDLVAEVIAMFFMVTYGAICLVSFFEQFAADPAFRPTFKSKWYISLGGGILSFILMFKMNFNYALASVVIMTIIYLLISRKKKRKKGIENLFKGVIFQVTRRLQIYLQKKDRHATDDHWRPFVLAISEDSFERRSSFDMVRWLGYKYGFGTYIHFINGFLNSETQKEAISTKKRLINMASGERSRVYLDTIISPSYTSAIAQSVQLPGISGKGNNMILFEYATDDRKNLAEMIRNFNILKAADMDICMLKSTYQGFGNRKNIHLWITSTDYENANMMILLGYILLGHPDWQDGSIKIYSLFEDEDIRDKEQRLMTLIKDGRLPISPNNIQLVRMEKDGDYRKSIIHHSGEADITLIGFNDEDVVAHGESLFDGYDSMGNVLFVNAFRQMKID